MCKTWTCIYFHGIPSFFGSSRQALCKDYGPPHSMSVFPELLCNLAWWGNLRWQDVKISIGACAFDASLRNIYRVTLFILSSLQPRNIVKIGYHCQIIMSTLWYIIMSALWYRLFVRHCNTSAYRPAQDGPIFQQTCTDTYGHINSRPSRSDKHSHTHMLLNANARKHRHTEAEPCMSHEQTASESTYRIT